MRHPPRNVCPLSPKRRINDSTHNPRPGRTARRELEGYIISAAFFGIVDPVQLMEEIPAEEVELEADVAAFVEVNAVVDTHFVYHGRFGFGGM